MTEERKEGYDGRKEGRKEDCNGGQEGRKVVTEGRKGRGKGCDGR